MMNINLLALNLIIIGFQEMENQM